MSARVGNYEKCDILKIVTHKSLYYACPSFTKESQHRLKIPNELLYIVNHLGIDMNRSFCIRSICWCYMCLATEGSRKMCIQKCIICSKATKDSSSSTWWKAHQCLRLWCHYWGKNELLLRYHTVKGARCQGDHPPTGAGQQPYKLKYIHYRLTSKTRITTSWFSASSFEEIQLRCYHDIMFIRTGGQTAQKLNGLGPGCHHCRSKSTLQNCPVRVQT